MSGPSDRAPRGDDTESRRLAVRSASGDAGPRAIGEALADPDWRVRKEAATAAGRLGGDPAMIEILVDALLQPDDVGLRNAAIEAFAHVGPRGASALLDALARSTETARKFVCAALGGTGPRGVPALAVLARDPDPNTATVALESLARIGGDAAERAILDRIAAEDWVVRLAALEGLAQLRARVPVATLAPMIGDALVRRLAIRLLGRAGDREATGPLLRALAAPTSDAELTEVVVALASLAEEGAADSPAIERAVRALPEETLASLRALVGREEDVTAARAGAQVLAIARDVLALPAIAALAARAELGPAALAALRGFGEGAVRPLLSIGPGLDPPARAWALEAAAELAATAALDEAARMALKDDVRATLTRALEAREEIVVQAATRGLAHWAEPEDAPLFLRVGSLRPGSIARAAGSALEALSLAAPQSVELALEDVEPEGAEAWSLAIAALPEEVALAKLRAAISGGEAASRRAAVLVLDRIDSEESAQMAAVALADEDVDVRIAAVTALSRMTRAEGREIASRTLLVAMREESAAVRAAAARGLGALGDASAAAAIRELVRDTGPGVALAALTALRTLRRGGAAAASEPDLEEVLVDVLGHPDDEVVKEGLLAVAEAPLARKEARLAIGLTHAAWDVRRLAAELLGRLGTEDGRARLREREPLEDDDLVRLAIADALRAKGEV